MKDRRFTVGIDARRLGGNRRGIGQVVHSIIWQIPHVAPDLELLLFVDRSLPTNAVPEGCRQVVVGRRPSFESQSYSRFNSQLYSVYWMAVLVPAALRRARIDVFHGMNVAIPLARGLPCVSTIHDLVSERIPDTFSPLYVRYRHLLVADVVRRADHIVAVSECTRRDVVDVFTANPSCVSTIHNAVDDGLAPVSVPDKLNDVRRRYGIPGRYVLTVGAVERQKRLGPFLAAAAEMIRRQLIECVVLAGEEGRGADDVRRQVVELGIADRVRLLGFVPQDDIPALYSLAACSVYPSWYEGFGLPVLEAMACGTPVITSNVSSLPEVAGDAALLVSPGDSRAIADALGMVLTDASLRQSLIERGFGRVKQFSWRRSAEQYVQLYRRIIERHTRS